MKLGAHSTSDQSQPCSQPHLSSYWLLGHGTGSVGRWAEAAAVLALVRSSCRRQLPPSGAFVQVAAGLATSPPLPAFYFVNITRPPWKINKSEKGGQDSRGDVATVEVRIISHPHI